MQTVYLRLDSELWDDALKSSPLLKRGWTLQEALLAPKTLSFGSQQMIWECSSHRFDEGVRITEPLQDYKDKTYMQMVLRPAIMPKPRMLRDIEDWLPSRVKNIFHPHYFVRGSSDVLDPYDRWYDVGIRTCYNISIIGTTHDPRLFKTLLLAR